MRLRRMGIDPGSQLGWAVIEYEGRDVSLVASGTLDARKPGGLRHVREELASIIGMSPLAGIAADSLLETKGEKPTYCPKLSYWVEGIVHELLSEPGYPPTRYYNFSQARRYLGCRDKAEVRKFAEAVIGMELRGKPDHESDAIGIGIANLIAEERVFPRLKWAIQLTRKQSRLVETSRPPAKIRPGEPEIIDLRNNPAARAELLEMIGSGKARLRIK